MGRSPWLPLFLGISMLLSACSGGDAPSNAPASAPSPTADGAPASGSGGLPTPSSGPGDPTSPPAVPSAPTPMPTSAEVWQTAELRDVRTGEAFSVASLGGRLVVIEPMAMWCTNCRAQQKEAAEALDNINDPNIVYISLDVEPSENESELARYADGLGFAWHFVVASREVARSLANVFGDTVLAPPAVPSIIVNPDGRVESSFGFRSAADLEAELTTRLP